MTTKDLKTVRINLKVAPAFRDEFAAAVRARGADSVSDVIRQMMFDFIRAQRIDRPDMFVMFDQSSTNSNVQQIQGIQKNVPSELVKEPSRSRKSATVNDAKKEINRQKRSKHK